MFKKVKTVVAKQGIKGTLSAIKASVVIHLNDNWSLIVVLLLVAFLYGTYLLFAYNVPMDAEEQGIDPEEAAYTRKKQKRGYLVLLGCSLFLAIVAQIVLI